MKVVIIGAAAVLVFDTVASLASFTLNFPYVYASVGSFLIYASVGYYIFLESKLLACIAAANLVELVDATLGWFISWKIGPGAVSWGEVTTLFVVIFILFLILFASVTALLGAGLARVLHGNKI